MIDFDFGQTLTIDRIGLFNNPIRGILSLEVYTSAISDFSVSAMVGSFSLSLSNSNTARAPLDTLDVIDTSARYMRLNILSYAEPDTLRIVSFGEVFASADVPLPASAGLLLGGVALLGALRRRARG